MSLEGKNILLVSPEPWGHLFVSKHHYAICLSRKGNRVFFLNPPSSISGITGTEHENLWSVNYRGFPKGLRYYPSFFHKIFFLKVYRELERTCDVTFDVVWSFDSSVFFDFSLLPTSTLRVLHIVDFNQNFQIAKAAKTADICFCTSEYIKKRLLLYNRNIFKINHGYAFANQMNMEVMGVDNSSNLKAGYAGNLDLQYIDWDLFEKVILENQGIDFYFAGSLENLERKDFFDKQPNVKYLDVLEANALTAFYERMDILLLSYKADQYKKQLANPHKMMGYLGSGKMIVTTYTKEYEKLVTQGLLLMSQNNKDFSDLLQQASLNIQTWNSDEKIGARKEFAFSNTYEKQIKKIESLLQTHVF